MNIGQHHINLRQRVHQKLEPYPHPQRKYRLMDRFIFVIGVLGPLMTVPQIIVIWREKTAAGLSIISWLAFLIFNFCWMEYGFMHKDKPIILTNALLILANGLVVLGIFLYG